jgi:hypothetical protein
MCDFVCCGERFEAHEGAVCGCLVDGLRGLLNIRIWVLLCLWVVTLDCVGLVVWRGLCEHVAEYDCCFDVGWELV